MSAAQRSYRIGNCLIAGFPVGTGVYNGDQVFDPGVAITAGNDHIALIQRGFDPVQKCLPLGGGGHFIIAGILDPHLIVVLDPVVLGNLPVAV